MIEQTIHCRMTSKDAEEIAAKLRFIEQNGKWGGSLEAYTWFVENSVPQTSIKFVVNQERAGKQGLLKGEMAKITGCCESQHSI